jgi:hypothetical protein
VIIGIERSRTRLLSAFFFPILPKRNRISFYPCHSKTNIDLQRVQGRCDRAARFRRPRNHQENVYPSQHSVILRRLKASPFQHGVHKLTGEDGIQPTAGALNGRGHRGQINGSQSGQMRRVGALKGKKPPPSLAQGSHPNVSPSSTPSPDQRVGVEGRRMLTGKHAENSSKKAIICTMGCPNYRAP